MAVIPPPLLDASQRKYVFHSTDGLIRDPMALHSELPNHNVWSESEKEAFRERYLQHPKQWHLISAALDAKSTSACVNYYYHSKKQHKYKERLKKARTRGRNRGLAKPTQALAAVEVIGGIGTGVTTRGSVAALQRERAGTGGSLGTDPAAAAAATDAADADAAAVSEAGAEEKPAVAAPSSPPTSAPTAPTSSPAPAPAPAETPPRSVSPQGTAAGSAD